MPMKASRAPLDRLLGKSLYVSMLLERSATSSPPERYHLTKSIKAVARFMTESIATAGWRRERITLPTAESPNLAGPIGRVIRFWRRRRLWIDTDP